VAGAAPSQARSRSKNRNGINLLASYNQWETNMNLRYFIRTAVLATGVLLQLLGAPGFAQDANSKNPPAAPAAPAAPAKYTAPEPWGGLGFGLGVSLSTDLGRVSHVVSADNVNGIVRVKDTQDVVVGFVLEAHYFFNQGNFPWLGNWNSTWGTGPFVAIEIGSSSAAPTAGGPITAYGLGWMVGFREPTKWDYSNPNNPKPVYTGTGNLSWNLGLGLRVDPRAQVLGDGLVANQPLPPGDQIRYRTLPRYSLMIVSSFGF